MPMPWFAMRRPASLLAMQALALLSYAAPGAAATSPELASVFVGYVHGMPADIHYDMYTHLCHAFVVSDEQGNLTPNKQVPSRELARAAHAAGVKVSLSVGGWGCDRQFAAVVADPAAEARYLDAVMKLVDDFDYDGVDVDVDWEYPDTLPETAGFNRLALSLRRRLDELGRRKGRPMILTMAASARPATLKWLDVAVLLESMDWIHVMTYDYAGEWSTVAGHHSPLFASSKVPEESPMSTELTLSYLVNDKKLPPHRLAMGLPLYGRAFAVDQPYAPIVGDKNVPDGAYNFARLEELRTHHGWERLWDDETKNPWLLAPEDSRIVGYDDGESAAIETKWAGEQGFRGVFFWQIAGDRLPNGSNPVQEASHEMWLRTTDKH